MSKIKKIFKNYKVIILLVFILFAIVAIRPNFGVEGVAIRSVVHNSSASIAGLQNPKANSAPMSRERIEDINGNKIRDVVDYFKFIDTLKAGQSFTIKTNKGVYKVTTMPILSTIILNETEEKEIQKFNETTNITIVEKFIVNKTKTEVIGMEDIGLGVYNAPTTNIRKGLDLQGGIRVLLQPEKKISQNDMDILLESMKQRLNVFGLSDLVVRETKDLSGNQFILVEIAGANEGEVKELLAKQGKFEAKIGNETVFRGGQDITYVARSADRAGIDPQSGCSQGQGQWICRFRFGITLTPDAAKKQADLTRNLGIITEQNSQYLSEQLVLYLDDAEVDKLNIGAELRGQATTDIAISGSGVGPSRQEAIFDALNNMKRLQTILITGSLPVKLNIAQTNNISPILGEQFIKNALKVGIFAILAVVLVVYIRYRRLEVALPISLTMIAEVFLLLGLASLIGWNLDLAAIAGIIIAVGTGVNSQIVITDEFLNKEKVEDTSLKEKMKRAFFIIMGSYFTVVVAMIPLWFAGAGLLKGFATITIFGATFGVFITRQAYAAIVEILLKPE